MSFLMASLSTGCPCECVSEASSTIVWICRRGPAEGRASPETLHCPLSVTEGLIGTQAGVC